MKKNKMRRNVKIKAVFFMLTITSMFVLINACNKDKIANPASPGEAVNRQAEIPAVQNQPITRNLTVSAIRIPADGSPATVLFNENEEVFHVQDAALLAGLQKAYKGGTKIKVTFDPWQAKVVQVAALTDIEKSMTGAKEVITNSGTATHIDLARMSPEMIDNPERIGVINTTSVGLTNVIPDMATAQLMFNYITKQCCKLPGPYAIDYCISFQYAYDGCYARAHKMCYILNTKYHYNTHKIFSFANAGSDVLSVKAEKWGGCCVNWWYHVAPLVNIKTASGTKAYVFDPAMFDQPVLLSAWLHAQQNPDCAGGSTAHVSMINVQGTAAYSPHDGTGYTFDTDPTFSGTNSTLTAYSGLTTCY